MIRSAPAVLLALLLATGSSAWGCPNCVRGLSDPGSGTRNAPLAYNTSILFMAGMPFAITGFFGVTFWRLSRRRPENSKGGRYRCHPSSRS